jgi:hypothetical protein
MVGRDIVLSAAAYGGLATLAALIGATVKGYLDHRRLLPLNNLSGSWKGQLTYLGARSGADRVMLRLHQRRPWEPAYWLNPRLLTGTIDYHGELTCRGGFYDHNQLQLNYVADSQTVRQFGSLFLSLDADTGGLRGFLAGFQQGGNFAGNVALTKVKDAVVQPAPQTSALGACTDQHCSLEEPSNQPQAASSPQPT